MSYQQPQYIQYQPINSTTNKQIYPTFTNYQTDATQTDDINLLPNQPVQYEERSRTETKTFTNPPQPSPTQPVQYANYQNETKTYVANPPNQPSSSQPVHYENYRTETKSYTNPPQAYPQGQPTQYTNYRTYSKSYTVPPQQYGYQNVHNLPVDQVNANAPVQTYTNQGLPVDHINFGYQNNPYGQDNYNKGVGGQVDTAGRNFRGALGSFGHAIGNLGHAIFNAVDRGADAIGGNNMKKKPKTEAQTTTTTTTQVNQVGPSQP